MTDSESDNPGMDASNAAIEIDELRAENAESRSICSHCGGNHTFGHGRCTYPQGWEPTTDAQRAKIEQFGLRLDIGPGNHPRDVERFISVDKYPAAALSIGHPPDVEADMGDLPFADDSVKEIWCAHTLEHVPANRVNAVLTEWYRVLAPGARVILQVPNFDYVARYWLTGADRPWAEAIVFGEGRWGEGDYHRCAFTPTTLRADLEAAKFKVLRVEMKWTHSQETIQAVGLKPESA